MPAPVIPPPTMIKSQSLASDCQADWRSALPYNVVAPLSMAASPHRDSLWKTELAAPGIDQLARIHNAVRVAMVDHFTQQRHAECALLRLEIGRMIDAHAV